MSEKIEEGFNVRVYGILQSEGHVLLSDEIHAGQKLLKFPGGGLEFAESPEKGLIREFKEEVDLNVKLGDFFYASKNFHRSYFRPMQMISLYWNVCLADNLSIAKSVFSGHSNPVFLDEKKEHSQRLYWHDLKTLQVAEFTTELDREVAEKLLRRKA